MEGAELVQENGTGIGGGGMEEAELVRTGSRWERWREMDWRRGKNWLRMGEMGRN